MEGGACFLLQVSKQMSKFYYLKTLPKHRGKEYRQVKAAPRIGIDNFLAQEKKKKSTGWHLNWLHLSLTEILIKKTRF